MNKPTISVLMTTYGGEKAEYLQRSLESMFAQTVAPDQMVLTIDGPIAADQEAVIAQYQRDQRIADVVVVRLPVNVGLGPALNAGLDSCTGEWIMRMDSDDVSVLERTQAQIDYVAEHPEADLIGGWAEEFFTDSPRIRIKSSPITHDAVVQALKWRNVLVHPTILLRATTLRAMNGYRGEFPLLEDWDLFIRLIQAGYRFVVVPKVLVRVAAGRDQSSRRGGWRYVRNEVRFRRFCWTSGFLSFNQYVTITMAYLAFRLAGPVIRGGLYRIVRTQEVSNHA